MLLDPLAQIDAVTIGAVAGIVLATMLALRRIFFGPLIEVMERRARRIEAARARRQEADDLLRDARLRAERLLAASRDEAAGIVDAAREDARRVSAARVAGASREAEAVLTRGREALEALRRSEEARLADELYACVGQALARMVGPVEERSLRFLVSRALATKGHE
jgi:F-type H+-transporting ATPase subunit b